MIGSPRPHTTDRKVYKFTQTYSKPYVQMTIETLEAMMLLPLGIGLGAYSLVMTQELVGGLGDCPRVARLVRSPGGPTDMPHPPTYSRQVWQLLLSGRSILVDDYSGNTLEERYENAVNAPGA